MGEPEWLFPSELGTPLDEANVSRAFRRILNRAKLPAFRVSRACSQARARRLPT